MSLYLSVELFLQKNASMSVPLQVHSWNKCQPGMQSSGSRVFVASSVAVPYNSHAGE